MSVYIPILVAGLLGLFNPGYSQSSHAELKNKAKVLPRGISHIVMYGQSLMLGTSSVPAITLKQKYNTLMFEGGVRSGYDTGENIFHRSFAPLVEKEIKSKYTGSALGETPASGFSESMIGLLIKENHLTVDPEVKSLAKNDLQLLISSPAQGSSSVADLSEGGVYWERFKKDITEGYRLALAEGRPYNVPFILWNQGERDIDLNTSPDAYKASLGDLRIKADKFIKSVTGQKNTVRLILYQVTSHNVRNAQGKPDIANAQYELAKSDPFITMSNTTYQLPYAADHVHFSNIASKLNGAYHGVAAKRIMVDGRDWRPISVKKSSFKGSTVSLHFHVPAPPLLFDTNTVTNPGNYGFRIWDINGKEVKIKGVKIHDGKTVDISVAQKVKKGFYLWYGNNGSSTGPTSGARGNLRDSQGQKLTLDIDGSIERLDNWCPIFKEVL